MPLAIVSSASMNTGVQISETALSIPLGMYPEVALLDHKVSLFYIFGDAAILFSIVAAPFPSSASSAQCSNFSASSPALVISLVFHFFFFLIVVIALVKKRVSTHF